MIYAYKLTIGFEENLTRLTNQNAKETMDQQNFACSSVANDRHRNHFIEGKTRQRMAVADENDDINGQQNGARHMNNNIDDVDFNVAGDLNPMFIPSVSLMASYYAKTELTIKIATKNVLCFDYRSSTTLPAFSHALISNGVAS